MKHSRDRPAIGTTISSVIQVIKLPKEKRREQLTFHRPLVRSTSPGADVWANEKQGASGSRDPAPSQLHGSRGAGPHHLSADHLERRVDAGMLAEPLQHSKEQPGEKQTLVFTLLFLGLFTF